MSRGSNRDGQPHQHNERHIQSINHGFEGHLNSNSHRHQEHRGQGQGLGQGQGPGQGLGGNPGQDAGMGQQIRVGAPRGPIQNKENFHSYGGYDDHIDGEQPEATAKDVWDDIAMASGSSDPIDNKSTNNRNNGNYNNNHQSNNNINNSNSNSNSNQNSNHGNHNNHCYRNEDADDDDIWGQLDTLPVSTLPVQPSIAAMSHQQKQNSSHYQQQRQQQPPPPPPQQRQQQQQPPHMAYAHRPSQPTLHSALGNTNSRTDAPVPRPHQPSSHSYPTHSQSYQAHDANIPEGFFSSMASSSASAPPPGQGPGQGQGQGQGFSPGPWPLPSPTEASIWDF